MYGVDVSPLAAFVAAHRTWRGGVLPADPHTPYPSSKALGFWFLRSKLLINCDELLAYLLSCSRCVPIMWRPERLEETLALMRRAAAAALEVGHCSLAPYLPQVDPVLTALDFQLWKLQNDERLSNFAFSCGSRPFIEGLDDASAAINAEAAAARAARAEADEAAAEAAAAGQASSEAATEDEGEQGDGGDRVDRSGRSGGGGDARAGRARGGGGGAGAVPRDW